MRRVILLAGLAVAGGLVTVPSAASASATRPPKVPACYSSTGSCEGIFLKAAIGATKETSASHGVFHLTGPAPKQFTTPVSCGDAACLYNHLNWVVGPGARSTTGCQPNTTTCSVKIAPGSSHWVPVLVNQNDYPVALFLLWAPSSKTCAFKETESAHLAAASCPTLSIDDKRPKTGKILDKFAIGFHFHGEHWSKTGGPIHIYWSGHLAETFPAGKSFEHDFFASEWPRRNRTSCYATLAAKQGSVTRALVLKDEAVAQVIFADNDKVFKNNDAVCKGEALTLEHTDGTVLVYYAGFIHYYSGNGNVIKGGINIPPAGKEACFRLHPSKRGHVSVSRASNGGLDAVPGPGPCP